MLFAVKMSLMIILNVTKNRGFNLSLENTALEKPIGRKVKLTPPAFLVLMKSQGFLSTLLEQ